jgi:putative resolvase
MSNAQCPMPNAPFKYKIQRVYKKSNEEVTCEQELVQNMIELITVFSARLYGSRSQKNKKLIDGMTQVVKEVS